MLMRRRIIVFFIIVVALLIKSCHPCETEIIDHGSLSDEQKKIIPYFQDDTLILTHNSGFQISYICTRHLTVDYFECEECCDYRIKFEREMVTLSPNYPVFDIQFSIDNADTLHINYYCNIGQFGYYLPFADQFETEILDSMSINNKIYYDVYCLKAYDSGFVQDSIRPDSLYINKTEGVLKIVISNGEYYEI
jgi:hypothetical protein